VPARKQEINAGAAQSLLEGLAHSRCEIVVGEQSAQFGDHRFDRGPRIPAFCGVSANMRHPCNSTAKDSHILYTYQMHAESKMTLFVD
jgi:hypothetical protein